MFFFLCIALGVGSKNGQHIFELMTNLHDQKDVTLVLVTHDSALASQAQRQVVLKDGRVASDHTESLAEA